MHPPGFLSRRELFAVSSGRRQGASTGAASNAALGISTDFLRYAQFKRLRRFLVTERSFGWCGFHLACWRTNFVFVEVRRGARTVVPLVTFAGFGGCLCCTRCVAGAFRNELFRCLDAYAYRFASAHSGAVSHARRGGSGRKFQGRSRWRSRWGTRHGEDFINLQPTGFRQSLIKNMQALVRKKMPFSAG